MLINIGGLIDQAKCYNTVRELRWPKGTVCICCNSRNVVNNGHKSTRPDCQKYICNDCGKQFDDLSNTIFTGHHQPLAIWILCIYFMGLNLSNCQIAKELELCASDVQEMTQKLREGVEAKRPEIVLAGEVEFDEVYVVAGHKGNPENVKKKNVREGATGLREQEAEEL